MGRKIKKRLHSRAIGSAGEYRVISELLLRGYNPAIRMIDDGIDIVLDNKKTIQVKTVSHPVNRNNGKFYTISLASCKWRKGKKTKIKYSSKANFLIIWVIDVDAFFIVPLFLSGYSISISLLGGKWKKYVDRWDLLNKKVNEEAK